MSHSAIYGIGSVAPRVAALFLLPLYTRYLDRADYGRVELVLSVVAAVAVLTQLGLVNAFFRFWFDEEDDARRAQVFRAAFWTLLATGTVAAGAVVAFAGPLATLLVDSANASSVQLVQIGALGVWVTTNYQLIAALYRVQQRPVAFTVASLCNLGATIALTVVLVVIFELEAAGLLLGNFLGSLVVYVVLLVAQRRWWVARPRARTGGEKLLMPMVRFGLPLVPAAAALWAVNLANRPVIKAVDGVAAVGLFAIAFKLSQAILLVVTAFQMSWPAFAHSIRDDDDARRTYAAVLSMYAAALALPVLAVGVLAPWLVRLLTTQEFHAAAPAVLPLCIGAALYGGYFISSIGAARAKRTGATWVVTLVAAGVEVALLVWLTPRYGIVGAAWACAAAYAVMFALMLANSQRHFPVPWQWLRLVRVLAVSGFVAGAASLLPHEGTLALLARAGLVLAYLPLLAASGFFTGAERTRIARLVGMGRRAQPAGQ